MSQEYDALGGGEVNINDYLDVLRRRKALFIQVFVVVVAAGIAVMAMSKPVYQTRAAILVGTRRQIIPIVNQDSVLSAFTDQWESEPLATQVQEMRTGGLIQQAIKETVRERPGITPPEVDIQADSTTSILNIDVTGADPSEAAELANKIADLKLADLKARDTEGLGQGIKLINTALGEQQKALERAQLELNRLDQANPSSQKEAREEAGKLRSALRSEYLRVRVKRGVTSECSIIATRVFNTARCGPLRPTAASHPARNPQNGAPGTSGGLQERPPGAFLSPPASLLPPSRPPGVRYGTTGAA